PAWGGDRHRTDMETGHHQAIAATEGDPPIEPTLGSSRQRSCGHRHPPTQWARTAAEHGEPARGGPDRPGGADPGTASGDAENKGGSGADRGRTPSPRMS